jgi:flagellar protein FliO/FliZ
MDPVRYFSALFMVGGLLAVAIWLLKRLRLTSRARGQGQLELISHTALGAREKLVVVRFGGKDVLLGVTPGVISRLAVSRNGMRDTPAVTRTGSPAP